METTYNYITHYGIADNPGGGLYPGANAWTGIVPLLFGTGTKLIKVWIWNQNAVIRFSYDGIVWGDDIVIWDSVQAEPFYLSAMSAQVINFTNGSLATYQIMGQW